MVLPLFLCIIQNHDRMLRTRHGFIGMKCLVGAYGIFLFVWCIAEIKYWHFIFTPLWIEICLSALLYQISDLRTSVLRYNFSYIRFFLPILQWRNLICLTETADKMTDIGETG